MQSDVGERVTRAVGRPVPGEDGERVGGAEIHDLGPLDAAGADRARRPVGLEASDAHRENL